MNRMSSLIARIFTVKSHAPSGRSPLPVIRRLSRRQLFLRRRERRQSLFCYAGLGVGMFLLAAVPGVVVFHRTPEQKAWQRMVESARRSQAASDVFAPATLPSKRLRQSITFTELSAFEFVLRDNSATTDRSTESSAEQTGLQIPEAVRALNGQFVEVEGFMVPLRVNAGITHDWLLVRDRALCCYGRMPRMNEWVRVQSRSGVQVVLDRVVRCGGRFSVGEMRDGGLLTGIYRLDADEVRTTKE